MQMLTKTLIGAHSVLAIASTTFAAAVRHTGRCLWGAASAADYVATRGGAGGDSGGVPKRSV